MFIQLENPHDQFLFTSRPYFSLQQDLNTLQQIISCRQRIAKLIHHLFQYKMLPEESIRKLQSMVHEQRELQQREGPTADVSCVEWPQKHITHEECSWKSHQNSSSNHAHHHNQQQQNEAQSKDHQSSSLEQSLAYFYNSSIAPFFNSQKIACTLDHLRTTIHRFKSDLQKFNRLDILQLFDQLEKQKLPPVRFYLFGRPIDAAEVLRQLKRDLKKKYKDRYSERKELHAKWEHLTKTNVDTMKINIKWELEGDVSSQQQQSASSASVEASDVVTTQSKEKTVEPKESTTASSRPVVEASTQSEEQNEASLPSTATDKSTASNEEEDLAPPEEQSAKKIFTSTTDEYIRNPRKLYTVQQLADLLPQYPLQIHQSKKRKRIVSETEENFFSLKRFKKEDRPGRRRLKIPKEHLVPDDMLQYLSKSKTLLHRVCNVELQQQIIDIDKAKNRKERLLAMLNNFPNLEKFVDEILYVLGEKEIDVKGRQSAHNSSAGQGGK